MESLLCKESRAVDQCIQPARLRPYIFSEESMLAALGAYRRRYTRPEKLGARCLLQAVQPLNLDGFRKVHLNSWFNGAMELVRPGNGTRSGTAGPPAGEGLANGLNNLGRGLGVEVS